MSAGSSRAMIFSKSVLLIISYPLRNHQRACRSPLLRAQTGAEIIDDLVMENLAAPRPPLGTGELFDANPQPAEAEHLRTEIELASHLFAQGGKEKQLAPLARLESQPQQIRLRHARGRRFRLLLRLDLEAQSAQGLFK